MNIKALLLICFFLVFQTPYSVINQRNKDVRNLKIETSFVTFFSNAPLEDITATSKMLVGLIDTSNSSFAFKMPMTSFKGFNSKLQKEHFEENYLEIDKFPTSKFSGKIIEEINFHSDGEYSIRAKGGLEIHGISKEQIIKCDLSIKNGTYTIESVFFINLSDYEISIPLLVKQKVSDKIQIKLRIVMK